MWSGDPNCQEDVGMSKTEGLGVHKHPADRAPFCVENSILLFGHVVLAARALDDPTLESVSVAFQQQMRRERERERERERVSNDFE